MKCDILVKAGIIVSSIIESIKELSIVKVEIRQDEYFYLKLREKQFYLLYLCERGRE